MVPAILLSLSCVAHGCAAPLVATLDSAWALQGGHHVTWGLSDGSVRVLVSFRDQAGLPGDTPGGIPVIGFSMPRLDIGPLSPSGLLREIGNPLGFSPGSNVFLERTGLSLDGSLLPDRIGIVIMPIQDTLGCYCMSGPTGALQWGVFADGAFASGFGAAACLAAATLPAERAGEEWLPGNARFPGGVLMDAAARIRLVAAAWSVETTVAASLTQREMPGAFWQLRAGASTDGANAAVIVGGSAGSYRTLSGAVLEAATVAEAFVGAKRAGDLLEVRCAIAVARPGFAPGPFLFTKEEAGIKLGRELEGRNGCTLGWKAEAWKRIDRETEGGRREESGCSASMHAATGVVEGSAGLELSSLRGLCFTSSCTFGNGGQWPRISLDACARHAGPGALELSFLAGLRTGNAGRSLSVRAGLEGCPARADAAEALRHLILEVSWHSRSKG